MAEDMRDEAYSTADEGTRESAGGRWRSRWRQVLAFRIGIVPLPVFVLLAATLAALVRLHRVPGEISSVIAITVVGGFACAEIGKRIPGLRSIGGAAICATFVPSALVYYLAHFHVSPKPLVQPVADFLKSTNFLYFFITAIVVGSILGMDRRALIQGFLKIFVPLAAGSVVAALVGTAVGTALGLGARHSLFFIVVPIMAGGVGEGAIPLSFGYAERMHRGQPEMFGLVQPSVMLGSLTAILLAGLLNYAGKRWPHLTGEGRLQPDKTNSGESEWRLEDKPGAVAPRGGTSEPAGPHQDRQAAALVDDEIPPSSGASASRSSADREAPGPMNVGTLRGGELHAEDGPDRQAAGPMDVGTIAAAGIMAISLYLLGVLIYERTGLPAPIVMLFLAVAAKLVRAVPADLQRGAHAVYDFFRVAVVYPLLFAVGAAMTPWDKLVSACHLANLVTIVATVASLMGTGFVVGRWLGMYPIEAAIVNATHSGQGGTGDIAILTAANRMELLPFAQVATRIGGAITVTLALLALSRWG